MDDEDQDIKIIETKVGIIEYTISNQLYSQKDVDDFYKFIANLIIKNEKKKLQNNIIR